MSEQMPNMNYDADEVIKDFKAKIKWPGSGEVTAVTAPKKLGLRILLAAVLTIIFGAAYYYMQLPALNIHDSGLYTFAIVFMAAFVLFFALLCKAHKRVERKEYVKKKLPVPIIIVGVILVVMVIGWVVGTTFFRASAYSKLMAVTSSDFSTDFKEINYDSVPRIDESRALTLADQKLGELSEYKSQYVVSTNTTMINYNGEPVRVAYLEYGDVFKWFNNTKAGLPAYMIINLVTQEVTVVNCLDEFGECIKYSPTELFNEKLVRHLRFQYPMLLMDTPNFEIDDSGRPYWITPVLNKTIGLFGGTDVKGIIITDALTGESQYYDIELVKNDQSLEWIDVVYSSTLLLTQYNYYGELSRGFWNSIIFQNDVNVVSSGNGYIALSDDIWIYTGVTSSESDSSNFGFILCNQRTKETRYYENGGAIESAAQASAEDAVQNYGYSATFPILLDIEGQPTYFMSFYGSGNIVKGYALVNLSDKTIVGTGLFDNSKGEAKALNAAVENYIEALQDKGILGNNVDLDEYLVDETADGSDNAAGGAGTDTPDADDEDDTAATGSITGTIDSIKTAVVGGDTYYYLQIDGVYYYIAVGDCMEVLLAEKGDRVKVTVQSDATGTFVAAQGIEFAD